MTDVPRYHLDQLRRFATALCAAGGVPPMRASALVSQLLWFDATGYPTWGLAGLPSWLDRMESGEVDRLAEGQVTEETLGTANFDGRNGIPPLILARAGGLAIEKARDAGIGLVRVSNLGATGPAAAIAAEMVAGPIVAILLGPGGAFSLGLPADEGLPAILDTALAPPAHGDKTKRTGRSARASLVDSWIPWASALVPERGWLVAAIGIKTIESLSTFQTRVGSRLKDLEESPGQLVPALGEARRQASREHGVGVTEAVRTRLNEWASRLGVPPLSLATHSPPAAVPPTGA